MAALPTAGTQSAEQALADMLPRIQELKELSGEALEGAMKDLKGALLANPAAAAIMLPEDIGEMVAALRRMTGQTVAEASKAKATGERRKKSIPLSAEAMQAALDEL
jgi:hypothetical protein